MTTTSKVIEAPHRYRMDHAYLVEQLSGGEPWGYEVWFRKFLLWFSTDRGKAQALVDQINEGRE